MFIEVGKHHEKIHTHTRQITDLYRSGEKEIANRLMAAFESEREDLLKKLDELYLV
ncbi:MAG: hypothetical protein PHI97_34960 [Desulfobulbus sp.]|nr:hypothetical protein [Desulfobulbus sp.]